uniref:CSON001406 protein n=1 Tax=Culicoides sonorensis TaxID=179676 RepID=A0A336KXW1_CULSO
MSVFGCLADYGKTIDATDIDASIFRRIMCFTYKEDIQIYSIEEASNLLYAAKKYKIMQLDKLCEKYLMSIIDDDNIEELNVLADTYKLKTLRRLTKLHSSGPDIDKAASWMRFEPGGLFPDGAIIAGYSNGIPICIGRCIYEGNILPGQVDPLTETITISYEKHCVQLKKFEVLCNGNLFWSRAMLGHVLADAVSGGTTELGETVYIGRAMHEGLLKIGKISPLSDNLIIPHLNSEVHIDDGYEVLIERPLNQI